MIKWSSICACVAALSGLGGCGASNLPSFPVQTVAKPPAELFAGPGKCRVRAEPLVFDAGTLWGGQPESAFVASLRPQAQKSHEADKPTTTDFYLQQLKINEHDYLKASGSVTTTSGGDEPLVVRSRVLSVNPSSGVVEAQHEIFAVATGQKVGEFKVAAQGLGYGLGMRLRAAAAGQAMTVLKYFADRFACNGPPRVTD